jgi:hypothetical protein
MPKKINVTTDLSLLEIKALRQRDQMKRDGLNSMKQRLIAWYTMEDPFELNEREQQMQARWERAKALFLEGRTYTDITETLRDEFDISIQAARKDVADIKNIFSPSDKIDKAQHRERAIEMIMRVYRNASNVGNDKLMLKAAQQYAVITGLDKPDEETYDIEKKMADRTYVEALDPQLRDMLMAIVTNAGGNIDTSKIFEGVMQAMPTHTADYEEVAQ